MWYNDYGNLCIANLGTMLTELHSVHSLCFLCSCNYTQAQTQVDEDDWNCSTKVKKSNEPINPGDVIFYWHPAFVSNTKQAERTATVMEVDPEKDIPLRLSNNDCLEPMKEVKRIKVMNCGVLQDHPRGIFRYIAEFKLVKAGPLPGHKRKSMEAVRLENIMGRFTRDYLRVADEQGMPQDLICLPTKPPQDVMTSKKGDDAMTQDEEDNKETSVDEDTTKSGTNYHQMYLKATQQRREIEAKAAAAQKKQAEDVNKNREWEGGLVLEKGLVCVLKCPKERNTLSPPYLPVEIIEVITYSKTNTIRYKVCTKDTILTGTFGREQLKPRPYLSPTMMGIKYTSLDKKTTLSLSDACNAYLKVTGKQTRCRCKTDCSTSSTCKCRKLNKFCTKFCHGTHGHGCCRMRADGDSDYDDEN